MPLLLSESTACPAGKRVHLHSRGCLRIGRVQEGMVQCLCPVSPSEPNPYPRVGLPKGVKLSVGDERKSYLFTSELFALVDHSAGQGSTFDKTPSKCLLSSLRPFEGSKAPSAHLGELPAPVRCPVRIPPCLPMLGQNQMWLHMILPLLGDTSGSRTGCSSAREPWRPRVLLCPTWTPPAAVSQPMCWGTG